jgi:hypothetical protein
LDLKPRNPRYKCLVSEKTMNVEEKILQVSFTKKVKSTNVMETFLFLLTMRGNNLERLSLVSFLAHLIVATKDQFILRLSVC